MELFATSFPLVLLGGLLVGLLGIGLGAYAGASIRSLTRAAGVPLAAGIGLGSGLVAAIGAVALVLALIFVRGFGLPVGNLAAGLAFGLIVALVTIDWAGAALAGAFVGTLAATSIGGALALANLAPFLRFLPPFIVNSLGAIFLSLFALTGLLALGLVAALVARLINVYVLSNDNQAVS